MKFLRHILTSILAIYVLILPMLPFIEYYSLKEYISENFCINKDEPNSCCKGKCFLENRLDESRENEKNENIPLRASKEHLIVDLPPSKIVLHQSEDRLIHSSLFICNYYLQYSAGFFRPPKVC